MPATMPAATPSGASCVVGTLTRRDELARRGIDRDDVGKRSADVDPDANAFASAVAPLLPIGEKHVASPSRARRAPSCSYRSKRARRSRRSGPRPARGRQIRRRGRPPEQRLAIETLSSKDTRARAIRAFGKAANVASASVAQRFGVVGRVGAHDVTVGSS